MSATECTVRKPGKVLPVTQAAIAAAIAAGMSRTEAAQRFKLHRNTIARICRDVRKVANNANPFSTAWEPTAIQESQDAYLRAIRCKDDVYKAGNIAVEGLKGLKVFVTGVKVDKDVTIRVSWDSGEPQDVVDQAINVTPVVSQTE